MTTARSSDVLPFDALETTLANGLRVIVVPTGFPNLVSLQIPVQTGSRNEVEPGKSGFAHFFEHMMFRGTERIPAHVYKDIIAATGARQNAYTSDDYTNYHMTFAAEDLDRMLEVEADRFMGLRYTEEDFRTEARAVLGEYNKNAANPLQKLFEIQREEAYTVHTYRHTVMGFLADIEQMPEQFAYSREFFSRWYRPEYTTIVLAGALDPVQVTAMVERHWGAWQPGSFRADIPREPAAAGPVYAHVPWPAATLPWVMVASHAPAFSEGDPQHAALDLLFDLEFGETSELYRRLVETEQVVDVLRPSVPMNVDPSLATVLARLKEPAQATYVRDAIMRTVERCTREPVDAQRLAEAKSNARYGFARTLDNSESIAEVLAAFVHFRRSYDTVNQLYRQYDALTPDDLLRAARTHLTDAHLVVTTLSHEPLAADVSSLPALSSFTPAARADAGAEDARWITQPSPSPLVRFKLLFRVGSAHDPAGREGLAAMAAAMVTDAGSARMRIDEINRALFPMAASFTAQVDREMTVFTGVSHRDNLGRFLDIALPQLLDPGLREEDFSRVKQRQMNGLVQDLRSNNEEELAKEWLQAAAHAGTSYAHPPVGTVAGIDAITVDDVRDFMREAYTRASLLPGAAGDVPEESGARLRDELRRLAAGSILTAPVVEAHRPRGIEVRIIEKETRATAISLGHPIPVLRPDDDFVALWMVRGWLGDHRSFHSQLFQRIREVRGLNYGDYAYVEAFPRGMYQFFPDPNRARRSQLFEAWIRPVPPEQAVFAIKIALHEIGRVIDHGLTEAEFAATRRYLMKNVYVMTKTQDQQLGYALDSAWFSMGDYVMEMRRRMEGLTLAEVNAAARRHLSVQDLIISAVAADGAALREALLTDAPTTIAYDAPKPEDILAEDRIIGAMNLGIRRDAVTITPVEDVFAR
ncbi:MAG: insulinase family protein [Chloroflexi bacterium]|nr:insulinase family protein [Chloroflexota bacterium]